MLAGHGVLGSGLGNLNQVDEATLTLFESTDDGLVGELGEVFVLHDEVMKIVSQVVCTGGAAMTVENAEKANLRPLDVQVLLALGLQDVQNDGHAVFVVVPNDSLVGIRGVTLYNSAFLLRRFRRLMIFQKERFRIEHRWIFAEEERLDLYELNVVVVLRVLAREARVSAAFSRIVCICLVVGISP